MVKQLADAEIVSVVAAFIAVYGYAPDSVDMSRYCLRRPRSIVHRLRRLVQAGRLYRVHAGYAPVDGPHPRHRP